MNFARTLLAAALACAAATAIAADQDWQTSLKIADRSATAKTEKNGYRLDSNGHARAIAAQPLRSETASPLVDALFALAQAEAADARTRQLTDGAYNHGKPIPCDCFVTGVKWQFV